jgi:hypothetical protein
MHPPSKSLTSEALVAGKLTRHSLSLYTAVLSNTGDATELLIEGLGVSDVPQNLLEDSLKCLQVNLLPNPLISVIP